ncbi:hypothetical protein BOTBODRAFT_586475 [Botryobasidium botryosum FD-172 SS1]|uniref:Uncharacterized protein n=1 Tax=Botryobasidium botryosum (strain FD-172 SS1) TaxID=930990 RepID=A0A067M065_BOTB1|nr:hypothetical protein BOTBODRAFT_586475 [Botryobasidium botryosum FD-172 SS1]
MVPPSFILKTTAHKLRVPHIRTSPTLHLLEPHTARHCSYRSRRLYATHISHRRYCATASKKFSPRACFSVSRPCFYFLASPIVVFYPPCLPSPPPPPTVLYI